MARGEGGGGGNWKARREEMRVADASREQNENEQIQWEKQLQTQQAAEESYAELEERLRREALKRAQFKSGIGKFFIPRRNTLARHMLYVQDPEFGISFSAANYPYFDQIIEELYRSHKLHNPRHPKYEEMEPLRDNIAAVRNYIFTYYFPDGSFDPDDVGKAKYLAEIAAEMANALQRDSIFKRPFSTSVSVNAANAPFAGATLLYETILKVQNKKTLLKPWTLLGWPNKNWGLPKLQETPFAEQNYGDLSVVPGYGFAPPAPELGPQQNMTQPQASVGLALLSVSDELETQALALRSVDTLAEPARVESIELAREILEKLRLQFSQSATLDGLSQTPEAVMEQTQAMATAVNIFTQNLVAASKADPALLALPEIRDAQLAAGQLAYLSKLQVVETLKAEGQYQPAEELLKDMRENLPEEWRSFHGQSIEQLLRKIQRGVEITQAKSKAVEQQTMMFAQQPLVGAPAMPATTTKSMPVADLSKMKANMTTQVQQQATRNLAMDDTVQHQRQAKAAKAKFKEKATTLGGNTNLEKAAKALHADDINFLAGTNPTKLHYGQSVKPAKREDAINPALLEEQKRNR